MRGVAFAGVAVVVLLGSPALAQPWQESEASDAVDADDARAPVAVETTETTETTETETTETADATAAGSSGTSVSDVVELKDGSTFRGVITQKVVGEYVTILLPGGNTRHVDWGDVAYAGAWGDRREAAAQRETERREAKAKAEAHAQATEARFEFVGTAEPTLENPGGGYTLYRHTGVMVARATAMGSYGGFVSYDAVTHGFDRVCTAPCTATLPAGTYELALSGPGRDRPTTSTTQVTLPAGESRIEGWFESNASTRGWGWAIFGTGIAGGFALMVAAVDEQCVASQTAAGEYSSDCRLTLDTPMTVGGLGAWIIGMVVGGSMILETDEAFVTVVPTGPSPKSGTAGASGESLDPVEHDGAATSWQRLTASPGLTVVGRF